MGTIKARIAGIIKHSAVNGPGVRYVLFLQGCPHNCPCCQNPETHALKGGEERDLESIVSEIISDRYIDGLTLSGGDPLMQPEAALYIARAAKEKGINVWAYTGWTFEQIMGIETGGAEASNDIPEVPDGAREVLQYIDVLVDGRYVDGLHVNEDEEEQYMWRGSKNQRLIDVPKSLAQGRAIETGGEQ